jgi:hypothetical protein
LLKIKFIKKAFLPLRIKMLVYPDYHFCVYGCPHIPNTEHKAAFSGFTIGKAAPLLLSAAAAIANISRNRTGILKQAPQSLGRQSKRRNHANPFFTNNLNTLNHSIKPI